jgi:hypothetical protein
MQTHRTALLAQPQLVPTPVPPVGTVVGLGVTDALRVELQPCQIEALLDELDELARPLAETYDQARRRSLEISRLGERAWPASVQEAERDLTAAAYALRALTALRAQVPSTRPMASLALVGPTDLLTTVIAGAAQNVAATLVRLLDEPDRRDRRATERLRRLAAAAKAWTETYADCQTVEWFSFDPNWDPVDPV